MYVIKNKRMMQYLYSLGFNYQTQKDRTGINECVYIFQDTHLLRESITFYSNIHNKQKTFTPHFYGGLGRCNKRY